MELAQIVRDFASALKVADGKQPRALSHRSERVHQAGIGPHAEDAAVDLVAAELRAVSPGEYADLRLRIPYPNSRQKCDFVLGDPVRWAIEIKMARFRGDNAKPDDTAFKDILSPYDTDRSALSDCSKLIASGFPGKTAILVYGFEDSKRPLDNIISAFELLASGRVKLGDRQVASVGGLIHPVFRAARVFAWEIQTL